MISLNPIDVLKQRKVQTVPPHFKKMQLSETEIFEGIEDWVKVKLKGRYCLTRMPNLDSHGSLRSTHVIGFEDQKELTYFMLACSQLRRN